jgi:hypothetical protein
MRPAAHGEKKRGQTKTDLYHMVAVLVVEAQIVADENGLGLCQNNATTNGASRIGKYDRGGKHTAAANDRQEIENVQHPTCRSSVEELQATA